MEEAGGTREVYRDAVGHGPWKQNGGSDGIWMYRRIIR